jgi:hypothetical protein
MPKISKGNLNFYLYSTARGLLHQSRCLIPASLVQPRRQLDQDFSIGITTYVERYEEYFKPLYQSLSRYFPEVKITVSVNGHPNTEGQQKYLLRLQEELCSTAPAHHRFVLRDQAAGLTTMWNEILDLNLPLPVLILNDDLKIFPWMRRWAESFDWSSEQLTLLNSTWSHFVITKGVIDRVGAFDPGFKGIGFEDMDYTARAGLAEMPIGNVLCSYMAHKNHQPRSTSFGSDRVWGKYTSVNEEYFYSKWQICPDTEGVFIKQIPAHVKPKHPLSPIPLLPIPSTATTDGIRIFPDRPVRSPAGQCTPDAPGWHPDAGDEG